MSSPYLPVDNNLTIGYSDDISNDNGDTLPLNASIASLATMEDGKMYEIGAEVLRLKGSHDRGVVLGFPCAGKIRVKWQSADNSHISTTTLPIENVCTYSKERQEQLWTKQLNLYRR